MAAGTARWTPWTPRGTPGGWTSLAMDTFEIYIFLFLYPFYLLDFCLFATQPGDTADAIVCMSDL